MTGAVGEAAALELHAPGKVEAGGTIAITTVGSGPATLYLIGPGHVAKRQFKAGETIQISWNELRTAGTYQALACQEQECATVKFYVAPSRGSDLAFLVHPSRVAVARSNAISAVAVVLDRFQNLVLQPENLTFRATNKASAVSSSPQTTRNGVVWTRLNSGRNDGLVEISASIPGTSELRVVQQVAAEPCHLRASAVQKGDHIELQTDPVRDCGGNAVRDGTIVTFTKIDRLGRSTVDAPIKKGVARTEMGFAGSATVSVACGVVVGNDIRIGAAQ
jgi:hypothetical protein